jgi:bis(5'-nucleosyl)-tetraphosphatase (symmetrical)
LKPPNACGICPDKKFAGNSAGYIQRKGIMAVYAIGDVQGCFATLQTLLDRINYNSAHDTLWFTGDLVDRGPQSLEVLRFVKNLGGKAVVVLGNHDLHLLAVAAGTATARPHNTFQSILDAPDRWELTDWLATRPLLHQDADLGFTLVHAGFLPQWDLTYAKRLAREVEMAMADSRETFFRHLFGDRPDQWDDDLKPPDRWRTVINAMTRLRYCDSGGRMALRHNVPPVKRPPHLLPWFDVPGKRPYDSTIIFGHWSTLGICRGTDFVAIDSGCGWGGDLTVARIDVSPMQFYAVPGPMKGLPKNARKLTFPVPDPEKATYCTSRVERIIPEML